MATKSDTQQRLELRRAISSSAFTMVMLIVVLGLFSLFSIWSINRAWVSGTSETAELHRLARDAMEAEIAFKIQVQEWKNILLRGDNPSLLQKYTASFGDRSKETEENLSRVITEAASMGLVEQSRQATALSQAHQTITARYREALAEKLRNSAVLNSPEARDIDLALRGIDRDLETGIGEFADEIVKLSEDRRVRLTAEMHDRYVSLRWFIIGVILLGIIIMIYVLSRALGATRS